MRDRLLKQERVFKREMVEEERVIGITPPPEPTEVETAIREIIERGRNYKMLWIRRAKCCGKRKGGSRVSEKNIYGEVG